MHVLPYLYFDGRCEEALRFYEKAVGGQVTALLRFKETPEPHPPLPPGVEENVMHAEIRIGDTTLFASDGMRTGGQPSFQGISLTLAAGDEAEADRLFAALADGGEVRQPLTETFFSPRFGVLTDRFGVGWIVIVPREQ